MPTTNEKTLVMEEKKNKWIKPVSAGGAAVSLIALIVTVVVIKSSKDSGPEPDRREGGESNGGTPSPITKTKEECAKMLEEYKKQVEGGSLSSEDLDNLRDQGLKHCQSEFETYLKGTKGKKDSEGILVNGATDQSKKPKKRTKKNSDQGLGTQPPSPTLQVST